MTMTSQSSSVTTRRSRVALIVKEANERNALLNVLERDEQIEPIVLDQVQALSGADLEAMDALVSRGAAAAADIAALAKGCALVFVCVVDDGQVLAVAEEAARTARPAGVNRTNRARLSA